MSSRTRQITIAAAAALFLVGCASQDDEPAAPADATTEASSPTATAGPEEATEGALDAEDSTIAPEDVEALEGAQEALGANGYAGGADRATCDEVFGPEEDSLLTLFVGAQSITDPGESIEFVEHVVARTEGIAVAAPAEVAGHLELLAEALARSATFEGRSELDQIMVDTETAMVGVREHCFGA